MRKTISWTLALSGLLVMASMGPLGCEQMDESGSDVMGGPYYSPNAGYTPPESPQSPDDEANRYDAVGTNPFVIAAADPLSTFAADVDTASYDIFRRYIDMGVLPDPASVRLEEFVNAFDYDYPVPSAEDTAPFSITMAAAPSPFAETVLLSVGIQGQIVPVERRPANLVFLIDTSGSMMSSDKLPLVQLLLRESLDVLQPSDTIAIVAYASGTGVRLEPTPVSQRTTIESVINSLEAGGSTNGAGGIQLAYEQAESAFIEGGINHVLLCTDGDFNVGVSSTDGLVELIEAKRQTGITLTVLGFGWGNLNDAMMEAVSNAGNGIYGVITDADHAIEYVHDALLATLVHIAKDVKIQVEFNPDEVLAYRLLGYENRALADDEFRDDTVDAGEVGSGMRVTALYELVLVGGSIPDPEGAPAIDDTPTSEDKQGVLEGDLCRVRIRYKDVGASEQAPAHEVEEGLASAAIAPTFSQADGDFQWAAAIAAFAEILKESPFAPRESLGTIADIVGAHSGERRDRVEFQRLFQLARGMLGS
jgi:Ca-activated chloride channel family protein